MKFAPQCLLKTMLACGAMGWAQMSGAADCGAGLRGAQTLESAHYRLSYRTQPARIAVGRQFAIELVVCAKDQPSRVQGVTVDASMPEHAHGMNYKPTVLRVPPATATPGARFRADGLMFHMPGRWDLTFDVAGAGGTERLMRSIVLE
ncbi:MAG: hypothetical protein ABIS45_01315 [Burkholderiales bacterium]